MKVCALTTCHNRRELTLRALNSLYQNQLPDGCVMEVCLVDDGSTDGTSQAVMELYPDTILLKGNGNLFWAGGMRFGWEEYVKHSSFDYLLVFNDDIYLYSYAIKRLLITAENIQYKGYRYYVIAGSFCNYLNGGTTYGGMVRSHPWKSFKFRKITPSEIVCECDTLNMNFALIPHSTLKRFGFLSNKFIHNKADVDYGLSLGGKGGHVFLVPGYIGECCRKSKLTTSAEHGISIIERWRRLTSTKEYPLSETFYFYRKHAGPFWLFFLIYKYVNKMLFQKLLEDISRPFKD